jgi:serine/threonine protein kinase
MELEFCIVSGSNKGRTFGLPQGANLMFGKSKAVQCQIDDPDIALAHFEVRVEDGKIWLADCGSRAGTKVNDRGAAELELQVGDRVKIGSTELCLQEAGIPELKEPAVTMGGAAAKSKYKELEGTTLAHYEVGKLIAEGRSSVIYRGKDTKSKRRVAIKVLRPQFANTEERIQRFIRAMKAVLPMHHPNLISVYGAGKSSGLCWAAMEYVAGDSLDKVIKNIGIAGMLDWNYAFKVAVQIARALDFAYGHKIIHRNITPTNILMSSSGSAKLGDLMLAKGMEGEAAIEVTQMDGPGRMIGEEVLYMAPEQLRGEEVDCRSDIYALGATTYALLTGQPPLEGKNPLMAVLSGAKIKSPKTFQMAIPDLFENTVMQMLEAKARDRFETPAKLLAELNQVAKYSGIKVD